MLRGDTWVCTRVCKRALGTGCGSADGSAAPGMLLPARPRHHGRGEHHCTANGRDALTAVHWGWPRHIKQITLILHQFLPPLPLWMHLQNMLPVTQCPTEASAHQDQHHSSTAPAARPRLCRGSEDARGDFCEEEPLPCPGGTAGSGVLAWGHRSIAMGRRCHPPPPCRARAG